MSNLKHQTVAELTISKLTTENIIASLKSQLNGQQARLGINKYLYEKTPREMTFEEIERALGH